MNSQKLNSKSFGQRELSASQLNWIAANNYWNLWLPKALNGKEMPLSDGLKTLQNLAKIDGSLGWTVTLCSGANFFVGNLKQEIGETIFKASKAPVIFGGSGGAFGTAEKQGDQYMLSGVWKYATGAPYLTHFTLNAKITENGKLLKDKSDATIVRSFVIPAERVNIIEDWNTMGLKATATHSFEVKDVLVSEAYSFVYNEIYWPQPIFKIPFNTFADLTLWVNYLGMARHYQELVSPLLKKKKIDSLRSLLDHAEQSSDKYARKIETYIDRNKKLSNHEIAEYHKKVSQWLPAIAKCIIEIHPFVGMKAAREGEELNLVFKDFFTGTQHYNFVTR